MLGLPPTRLIELNNENAENIKIVELIHTDIYATVSYCWGGDQFVKTTTATILQHQIGIEISSLGQTLQDAIRVARSLNIPYLWVDSLCIIQDDAQDMAREIAKMSEYYENGYVSICASVASSCSEGFLGARTNNPYLYGPFELPYRGPGNHLGSIKLVRYHKYSRSKEPVTARAWIMQESILAPRLLSYSYQSMAWSCRKANHSDGGPTRHEWYDFGDRRTWANLQDEKDVEIILRKWNRLVESYTSRNLSDSKDRLPAISGIAQKCVKLLRKHLPADPESTGLGLERTVDTVPENDPERVNYVAGLWYCQVRFGTAPTMFSQQLLWSTSYYRSQTKHYQSTDHEPDTISRELIASTLDASRGSKPSIPTTKISQLLGSSSNRRYLAPSWSWAAVEVPIFYESTHKGLPQSSTFTIISCGTDLELSEAPYGNVTFGRLTVSGLLIPVGLTFHHTLYKQFLGWKLVYRPDTKESAAVLSKVMERKSEGWVLQLTDEGDMTSNKPIDPNWTANAPKGLLIVADGEYYRRIGLCSIERHTGNASKIGDTEGLFRSFGEEKQITII